MSAWDKKLARNPILRDRGRGGGGATFPRGVNGPVEIPLGAEGMQGGGVRGRSGAEENAALTLLAGGALAVFAFAGAGAGAGATCKEEKQVRMVPGHPTSEGVPGACVRVPDPQRAQLHSQLSVKRRTVEKRAPAALRTVVPWNPGVRKSRTPGSPSPGPAQAQLPVAQEQLGSMAS